MITINDRKYEVTVDGRFIHLAPKEFAILNILILADGDVISREQIKIKVWPETKGAKGYDSRTIDQHIATLRRKVGVKRRGMIQTIPNRGYKFNARA